MARPIGVPHSAEARANIAAGLRRIYEARRALGLPLQNWKRKRVVRQRGRPPLWVPPAEFAEMYADFTNRYGREEAERLVRDHAAVVERRRARANGSKPCVSSQS